VYTQVQYAGRIDRLCRIIGRPTILDIKTGSKERWHGVQFEAYCQALGDSVQDLQSVSIREDGSYRLEA